MRLGHVIGKVTLSCADPAYRGGRFLVVQPWTPTPRTPAAPSLVVYDELGAGAGQLVGFTEGSEAARPFAAPTPVDAYNAAIVDEIFHQPPK
jgi:ethanolamine utilization protein EutN